MYKRLLGLGLAVMLGFATIGCSDDAVNDIKDYAEGAEDPIESTLDEENKEEVKEEQPEVRQEEVKEDVVEEKQYDENLDIDKELSDLRQRTDESLEEGPGIPADPKYYATIPENAEISNGEYSCEEHPSGQFVQGYLDWTQYANEADWVLPFDDKHYVVALDADDNFAAYVFGSDIYDEYEQIKNLNYKDNPNGTIDITHRTDFYSSDQCYIGTLVINEKTLQAYYIVLSEYVEGLNYGMSMNFKHMANAN